MAMQVYHDQDADLRFLDGTQIAAIGYGNQGRAQALNLRDSGLEVVIGNRDDAYSEIAREDSFHVYPIPRAVQESQIVMLLVPDEVAPEVFDEVIVPYLTENDVLVFASGYNIAYDLIVPPEFVDVVMVAPRMIGAGVREMYVAGQGFPSFFGVAQDHSGCARDIALALAKGIGSTRTGVVEVTFAQEAELDLFTEQCFGPAFGHVLTTAATLLLDKGYPPAAVLLELYMSGELAYTLAKMAELGIVEQTALHSRTSQYGSMSRGIRYIMPELWERLESGLQEIRSGAFAREWTAEQEAGLPMLAALQEAARRLPLHKLEQELREKMRYEPPPRIGDGPESPN
jgi:ketol-acid reductoisomerase